MDETRKCPYCAEEIRTEAIRCPYCRSRIGALDPARWYRDHPERRLAGVAAAVAHALAFPVSWVRVGFIVLTFLHFVGPVVYLALWVVLPFQAGGPSLLERAIATVHGWFPGPGTPPPRRPANGADAHFDLVSGGPLA